MMPEGIVAKSCFHHNPVLDVWRSAGLEYRGQDGDLVSGWLSSAWNEQADQCFPGKIPGYCQKGSESLMQSGWCSQSGIVKSL